MSDPLHLVYRSQQAHNSRAVQPLERDSNTVYRKLCVRGRMEIQSLGDIGIVGGWYAVYGLYLLHHQCPVSFTSATRP
jgi:hypothetical protein